MTEGYDTRRLPVGTPVVKIGGDYEFPGTIVAAFETTSGKERFVVEATGKNGAHRGMLHIFNRAQLKVDIARLPDAPNVKSVRSIVKCTPCGGTGREHGALVAGKVIPCARCAGAGFVKILRVVENAA